MNKKVVENTLLMEPDCLRKHVIYHLCLDMHTMVMERTLRAHAGSLLTPKVLIYS